MSKVLSEIYKFMHTSLDLSRKTIHFTDDCWNIAEKVSSSTFKGMSKTTKAVHGVYSDLRTGMEDKKKKKEEAKKKEIQDYDEIIDGANMVLQYKKAKEAYKAQKLTRILIKKFGEKKFNEALKLVSDWS